MLAKDLQHCRIYLGVIPGSFPSIICSLLSGIRSIPSRRQYPSRRTHRHPRQHPPRPPQHPPLSAASPLQPRPRPRPRPRPLAASFTAAAAALGIPISVLASSWYLSHRRDQSACVPAGFATPKRSLPSWLSRCIFQKLTSCCPSSLHYPLSSEQILVVPNCTR